MFRYFFISIILSLLVCGCHERDNPDDPGAGDYYKGSSSSVSINKSSSSDGKSSNLLKISTIAIAADNSAGG